MEQEVKLININELVLWTENPRDPINEQALDQDIVNKALEDKLGKWTLRKLAKEMGDYYDFSELPTVVYHDKKPVVYDGNRRIILGKIKHGLVSVPEGTEIQLPYFPQKVPCNVCTKKIALDNVYRKHSGIGSWLPLERDIFLHKFMGKEKSPFLILEEDTGIISSNPHMNQRFVKDEIFRDDVMKSIGFSIVNGKLHSRHSDEEGYSILSDISRQVGEKNVTTRKNRGKILKVLSSLSQQLIEKNKNQKPKPSGLSFGESNNAIKNKRLSKRTVPPKIELFGGKLYLRAGDVSNLYRDIVDLYQFYVKEKDKLSKAFPNLIRMSLRLLCETASKSKQMKIENYLGKNFDNAKAPLDKDIKTTLANHNITRESITQLLHTGAHAYASSGNIEQTISLSIIVGAIITVTHGASE